MATQQQRAFHPRRNPKQPLTMVDFQKNAEACSTFPFSASRLWVVWIGGLDFDLNPSFLQRFNGKPLPILQTTSPESKPSIRGKLTFLLWAGGGRPMSM